MSTATAPPTPLDRPDHLVERPGQLGLRTLPTVLNHWDAENCLHVALAGYPTFGVVPFDEAFLPGYPFLSRFVAEGVFFTVTPNPTQVAAAMWLVIGLSAAVAAVLLWKVVRDRFDARVAAGAVALLVAGPYAHFMVAPYAGSPYLAWGSPRGCSSSAAAGSPGRCSASRRD
ncbi:hypothetical protein [Curtobacterium sp. NPDC092190]|uniref:hypothetical protein n=1 Tax=Curtobacterium sp. NPDC092190 TaxID=3363973 RepID=UPI003830056F